VVVCAADATTGVLIAVGGIDVVDAEGESLSEGGELRATRRKGIGGAADSGVDRLQNDDARSRTAVEPRRDKCRLCEGPIRARQ
jgi:hypothetical protein